MSGILYGIGTGPGDPELMTLKAVKTIKVSEIIAVPISRSDFTEPVLEEGNQKVHSSLLDECVAYQIAVQNVPEMNKKAILYLPMPMIKDKALLKEIHDKGTEMIISLLDEGKQIAFLTLGDPTVYSTYLYVHKRVLSRGYKAEIISGITSFCASAAKLNMGLVENKDELHVIPASYGIEEALKLSGTKVFMKAGKKMPQVKESVRNSGQEILMVENCGMEKEKIYYTLEEIPDEASYYSLIIVKEEK